MNKFIPEVSFEKLALSPAMFPLIGGAVGGVGGAMTSKEHPVRNAMIGAGIGAGAGFGAKALLSKAPAATAAAPKALLKAGPAETWGAAKKVPVMDALGRPQGFATMAEKLSMLKNYVHKYRNIF